MKVYLVYAKDSYVERDGSQRDLEFFGPWLRVKDAERACEDLRKLTQPNYSGTGVMELYESVDLVEREVFPHFEAWQIYV